MKKLSNPLWILASVTVPQIILILLYAGSYKIIGTLLLPENVRLWKIFGSLLISFISLNTIWAAYCFFSKKRISYWVSLVNIVIYISFLYGFAIYSDDIVPWNIPQWMLFQGDLTLYVFTFIMPVLVYSLFQIISVFTKDNREYKAWKHFLLAAVIPLLWYIGSRVYMQLSYSSRASKLYHLFAVIYIALLVLFLFLLLRGIYILLMKNQSVFAKYQLLWKIPVCILFPLAGLFLNNGFSKFDLNYLFGNFSHSSFYILSAFNGLLLCLPVNRFQPPLRLLVFFLTSVTFSFITYFFIVFLPFLPLSIIAIIVFGAGFLMLTPIIIMLIQSISLHKEYKHLQSHFGRVKISIAFATGFLVLPAYILIQYQAHRSTLNKALDYVYEGKYSTTSSQIKPGLLAEVLIAIESNADRNNRNFSFVSGNQNKPYLSAFYNWYVLNNLTLSQNKINTLKAIFVDGTTAAEKTPAAAFANSGRNTVTTQSNLSGVVLTKAASSSQYDGKNKYWRTWIDLKVAKSNNGVWGQEFETTFQLPVNCWVSNYYLVINGKKEYGIMAEKKAALWTYNNITSEQKDPGLLYYNKPGELTLKVFPVLAGSERETGFEIVHPFPVELFIDDKKIICGEQNVNDAENIMLFDNKVQLRSSDSNTISSLKKPADLFYYFVIDCSKKNIITGKRYLQVIQNTIDQLQINNDQYSIYTGNYAYIQSSLSTLETDCKQAGNKGGFFPEPIIRKLSADVFDKKSNQIPVFILATDNPKEAILTKSLDDISINIPGGVHTYFLTEKNDLYKTDRELVIGDLINPGSDDKIDLTAQLKDGQNSKDALMIADSTFGIATAKPANLLEEAVLQEMLCRDHALHPEKTEWLDVVKTGFRTKILNPFTSYIVVENEAQKAALLKKQRQTLNAKKSLDAGNESFTNMSEPGILWLMLIVSLIAVIKNKREKKSVCTV